MLLQGNEEGLGVGVTIVVICIIAVFVILILGAVIVILKPDLINKVSKKNNNSNDDSSAKSGNYSSSGDVKIGDTKQFLPYERILNYCIDLGNYNYRAIVEVSSLNYGLMSATEQEMVDASYRAFLDALDERRYPFITSGYFFKGDLFYNRGDTFSNESLSVELLDVSFDKLVSLSNAILKKFMINSVLLKDEDTESVFLIMKE